MEELKTPERYTQGSVECWDFLTDNGYPFLLASPVKYIWRFREKNGLEDLKKAHVFLSRIKVKADTVRVVKYPNFAVRIASSVGISVVPELVQYGEHTFDWMSEAQYDVLMAIHRLREPLDMPEFMHLLDIAIQKLEYLASVEYGVRLEGF